MKAWFETLGYGFEKHEVWEESYFEWIINIPAWRRRERILVRGIQGEAKISDVVALRQAVNEQRTDQGCLVAVRRISRAARTRLKRRKTRTSLVTPSMNYWTSRLTLAPISLARS
jgi:glycerol-3-phosphate O-acyltransferase